MEKYIEKAKVLIEALPYIKDFYGKTLVIKYGGSAMLDEKISETIIQDIVLMKFIGINVVIVHGGGPEINKMLKQLGKEPEFVKGLRVTDEETMDVVQMVLAGKINKDIVGYIQSHGLKAVGICGKDGNLLQAQKKLIDGNDVGYLGEIVSVDTSLIETLIQNDFIPVISPIGIDNDSNSYNINADYAAASIAGALKAQKLIFLTDIEGVLKDVNDKSSLISSLKVSEVKQLIENKTISGGMIPKVDCCVEAIKKGVKSVHILDGRIEHSLLLEIFTQKGIGTIVEE
jgi:acetylglutamate kinase